MKRLALLLFVAASCIVRGQDVTPPAPANGNLVRNGNFTSTIVRENLWDGVDAQNHLSGDRASAYATSESGRIASIPMPVSPQCADMNGDRLLDVITCDPSGIVRCYFNSGTASAPVFTHAEIVPIFPPRVAKDEAWDRNYWTWPHSSPKISVYDWNRRGVQDLIIGNYGGDIVLLPNTGNATTPSYAQPTAYKTVRVPLGKRPWGNLFAPCVCDWNNDGKPDLLVGEGSYSANAIHLLLNQSASSTPKFSDEERYYLCYGDGREQLIPTLADYNGDGHADVLVGDRKGTVAVHLHPGTWKPGQELPLASFVDFGGKTTLGQAIAPHACDLNGDGLFDLLLGRADGRIVLATNTGTKTAPKFSNPVEIKGENLWSQDIRLPKGWTIDTGMGRGNLYAFTSVQEEASPGQGKVLRSGYYQSPNRVFRMLDLMIDGRDTTDFFRYWWDQWYPMTANWAAEVRETDAWVIRQELPPMDVGATYQLSFRMRASAIKGGTATVAFLAANENEPTKFTRVGRGSKVVKDESHEEVLEEVTFGSSATWKQVEKTFSVRFKDRQLKAEKTTLAIIEFKFQLAQYTGFCELADVLLIKKQ